MQMKIVAYQMHIEWENKVVNYLHAENAILRAAREKAELFLLPEMSFTGFSMDTNKTKESDKATVGKMAGYATKYKIAIGFGWVKDCGIRAENHYTIINKNGDIVSDYAKIHPFSYAGENEKFRGGDKIVDFCIGDVRFSTFICYDLRFPEIFQIASSKADVIVIPANWPEARREHWKCLLRARAIENQVYIIGINCVGKIHELNYSGDSCIINPNGDILKELCDREGILEFELENDVKDIRDGFPVKRDRREDLYRNLNQGTLCSGF